MTREGSAICDAPSGCPAVSLTRLVAHTVHGFIRGVEDLVASRKPSPPTTDPLDQVLYSGALLYPSMIPTPGHFSASNLTMK